MIRKRLAMYEASMSNNMTMMMQWVMSMYVMIVSTVEYRCILWWCWGEMCDHMMDQYMMTPRSWQCWIIVYQSNNMIYDALSMCSCIILISITICMIKDLMSSCILYYHVSTLLYDYILDQRRWKEARIDIPK